MSATRLPNGLFFGILFAGVVQCLHDFEFLPDRLASHFGASGLPNGCMTKSHFVIVYALMIVPAAYLEYGLARTIEKYPRRLNLPNKDYWLASERRAGTFDYLAGFFAWYGCVVLLVEVLAMAMAMRANLNDPVRLPTGPIELVLGAFLIFNVVAVISMYRRFAMPA